jgi:hypothetical protein
VDDVGVRALVLLNVVIPLLFFMAWVYLALHVIFARLVSADNPALWFFGVVTGPLTRPVRGFLPRGTPETRVRTVALLVYFVCWIVVRGFFAAVLGPRIG